MQVKLQGFTFHLNGKQLRDLDELEKKIEKLSVEIEVNTATRQLHAKTTK